MNPHRLAQWSARPIYALFLTAALAGFVACDSADCIPTPITPERFRSRFLAEEFVVLRHRPILGPGGDTIPERQLSAFASDSFGLTVFEDCKGGLTHAQLRAASPDDAALQTFVDSLFGARPDLAAAYRTAMGLPPAPRSAPDRPARLRIDTLITCAQKQAYLEGLMRQDQDLRRGQDADIWLQYGYESPQADSFRLLTMTRDVELFERANYYVKRYGYPDPEEVGKDAADAPWLIFHHTHYPAFQRLNFDTLYAAYHRGAIDETQMALYLGRAHEGAFGYRHEMQSPYTGAQEVDTLKRLLGWEGRKER